MRVVLTQDMNHTFNFKWVKNVPINHNYNLIKLKLLYHCKQSIIKFFRTYHTINTNYTLRRSVSMVFDQSTHWPQRNGCKKNVFTSSLPLNDCTWSMVHLLYFLFVVNLAASYNWAKHYYSISDTRPYSDGAIDIAVVSKKTCVWLMCGIGRAIMR